MKFRPGYVKVLANSGRVRSACQERAFDRARDAIGPACPFSTRFESESLKPAEAASRTTICEGPNREIPDCESGERQSHIESGATSRCRFASHLAAVGLDNGFGDGQSQAGSPLLAGTPDSKTQIVPSARPG